MRGWKYMQPDAAIDDATRAKRKSERMRETSDPARNKRDRWRRRGGCLVACRRKRLARVARIRTTPRRPRRRPRRRALSRRRAGRRREIRESDAGGTTKTAARLQRDSALSSSDRGARADRARSKASGPRREPASAA